MHFPADRDINYFAQILAERSTLKTIGGKSYRVWEQLPGRANEALDMRVYAYAALQGLLNAGLKLNQRADEVSKRPRPSEMAPIVAPIANPRLVRHPLHQFHPTLPLTGGGPSSADWLSTMSHSSGFPVCLPVQTFDVSQTWLAGMTQPQLQQLYLSLVQPGHR